METHAISSQIIAQCEARYLAMQTMVVTLQTQNIQLQSRCDEYARAYDTLQHQMKELIRYRFGRRSERYLDPEDPQGQLFDTVVDVTKPSLEPAATSPETIPDKTTTPPAAKQGTRKYKALPRRIEIIAVNEADRHCPCGCDKTVIRYETRELIDHQPAVFEIVEQRREVMACPKGCDKQIVTAAAPLTVLPKIGVTEEFLSFLVISKCDDRQPLYHLERQLCERYGVDTSRQSMARWLIELIKPMQPVYNLMKDALIDYDVAACDATTLQVLDEPGRAPQTKSYVYCMHGGPPEQKVILYAYNDVEHQSFVNDWFRDFTGYLHVDGDNFFDEVGKVATRSYCMAHARRKFEPIAQHSKGNGLAKEALRFFKSLYKIERQATTLQLTPDKRHALRQKETTPLLEKFKQWLDEKAPTALPQSPLGQAFAYTLKRWKGLTQFMNDGRVQIDNNETERHIKPFVIARKNFLFAATPDGADALCMHFSFIRTAKAHGLDPYHYYVAVLKQLPHCQTVDDYEKLLPWNILSYYQLVH